MGWFSFGVLSVLVVLRRLAGEGVTRLVLGLQAKSMVTLLC